jgi:hypothetical protein
MQPRHTWLPLAFDWVARWQRPSGLSVVGAAAAGRRRARRGLCIRNAVAGQRSWGSYSASAYGSGRNQPPSVWRAARTARNPTERNAYEIEVGPLGGSERRHDRKARRCVYQLVESRLQPADNSNWPSWTWRAQCPVWRTALRLRRPCPTSWNPFFKAIASASVRAMSKTGTPVSKLHNSA